MLDGLTGVRFVLSDCADPRREADFNVWYDRYTADCLRPALFARVARFEDPHARESGHPRYLAVYETTRADPHQAWLDTADHPLRRHARDHTDLLVTGLRASYRLLDRVSAADPGGELCGLAVLLHDPLDDLSSQDSRWRSRLDAAVSSGYSQAALFELVDGSPRPPRWLELYEIRAGAPVQVEPGALPGSDRLVPRLATSYGLGSVARPLAP